MFMRLLAMKLRHLEHKNVFEIRHLEHKNMLEIRHPSRGTVARRFFYKVDRIIRRLSKMNEDASSE
jgi:hypothetical protein